MRARGNLSAASLLCCWLCCAAAYANELSNPSFEAGASNWVIGGPAQVQSAPWAASAGDAGVWFRGFDAGAPTVTQQVTAPASGDYVLLFDSRVEENFRTVASSFDVSFSAPAGSVSSDLLASAGPEFRSYSLKLPNVSAGDPLTVSASSSHAGGSGPQLSAFVDNFYLGASTDLRSTPLFDGERFDFNDSGRLVNNWGGGFNPGTFASLTKQSAVVRSGANAYRAELGPTGAGQTRFLQTYATQLRGAGDRNTRDLAYFDTLEMYVRNDTGADLTFGIELKDHRDTSAHSATKAFTVPVGGAWTKVATSLDLGDGWSVVGSPQLDQTYAVSFLATPNGQSTSGPIYLDDARLIEPGAAIDPLSAPIRDVAEALARRTFGGLWGSRSRQSGIVPNTSTTASLGALNTTSGLVWALPSAVRRGWVSEADADAYMSQLADTLNHNLDQTTYLPSRFVDLTTGDAFLEESSIDSAFLALGLHQYKNQPGLETALADKLHDVVNRFNFAALGSPQGWRFKYEDGQGISPGGYNGYTTEGKVISLAAELSETHHVDLAVHWNTDVQRVFDHLADPDLEAMVHTSAAFRAPFSQALVNLFVDMSSRGVDNYPDAALRVNPWQNFKDFEADSAAYLRGIGRPFFFQPDAARGGPPSGYKAYSLYDLHQAGGVTNEDLFMPWSATLALLTGIPEAETALRVLLANDLHGPLGMPDGARWDTGADDPTGVNALTDNWNMALSLMALMRYIDGVESGAHFLADLPQVSAALDTVFFDRTPGDYDLDGDVDADDYSVWSRALGGGDLSADGNGDGRVDAADYAVWRANLGVSASASIVAPEPATVGQIVLGFLVAAVGGRRRL